jgi:membrane protease YdiL (CAAX protease family)
MDATKAQIIAFIAALCLTTLALGLVVSWLIRNRRATDTPPQSGNVQTRPYDLLDLGLVGILISYFTLPLIATVAEGVPDTNATPATINTAIAIAVFTLLLGMAVFTFASLIRGRNPIGLFGISRLKPHKILAWSVAAFLVAYTAMVGVAYAQEYFFGREEDLQEVVKTLIGTDNPSLKIVLAITAMIIAPLVEEIIFRGYLYAVIKRYSGCCFAVITTSLLFAVVHGNLPGIMPLFTLAIILTLVYELTGCLWVPIATHSLFNAVQISLMLNLQNG